jgi:hypothetical protein
MGNGVFNVAKGKFASYADLPLANDAMIAVLLKGTIVADSAMQDYATLAAALAGNTEADFTTYVRKTLNSNAATVDQANNWMDVTAANLTWTAAGNSGSTAGSGAGNNVVGKLLICYDSDTTGGTDANIVPCTFHDCVFSTDGTDQVVTIPSPGYARAT